MLKFVRLWTLPAIGMSLLAACATGSFDPACVCPPVKEYDRAFQTQLAEEIEAAPEDTVFPVALQDYALMRAQARACREH